MAKKFFLGHFFFFGSVQKVVFTSCEEKSSQEGTIVID